MATVTLNGKDVSSARITFRIRGTWDAKIVTTASGSVPDGTPCTLDIGGDQFIGTIVRSVSDQGELVTNTVVGGSGRLNQEIGPVQFFATTVGIVLKAALAEGGELVGTTIDSDADVLSTPLQFFTGVRQTVGERIKAVLAAAEKALDEKLCWRVDFTGGVYVARQIFLPVDIDNVMVSESPNERSFTLALERASALPGRTVKLHDLTDVTYHLDGTRLRAVCTYGEEERSQVAAHQAMIIRRETAHVDYFASYEYTLVAQNADGSLELKGSDPRLPSSMSHIPMRSGLAGQTEGKLTPGTTVYLTHANGDQTKPMVTGWDMSQGMGLKMTHTAPIEFTAPSIEMGGKEPLTKQTPFMAWVASLATACAPMGISVPPYVDPGTVVLKGS